MSGNGSCLLPETLAGPGSSNPHTELLPVAGAPYNMAVWVLRVCIAFSNSASEVMHHPLWHIPLVRNGSKRQPRFKRSLGSTFGRVVSSKMQTCYKTTILSTTIKASHWSPVLKPCFLAQKACIPPLLCPCQTLGLRAEDITDGPMLELTMDGSWIRSQNTGRVYPHRVKILPQWLHNKPTTPWSSRVFVPTPPEASSSPTKLGSWAQLPGQPWQNLNHKLTKVLCQMK